MTSLAGRRVVITGATGGLGAAAVRAAVDAGAMVVLVGREQQRLAAVASPFRDAVEATEVADLLDDAAVIRLASGAGAGADAVWHLVGGWRGGVPFAEQPLDDWNWLHDQLVRTTVHVARTFAPVLKASDHGRFAIVSAKEAQSPSSANAAYASAKAAAEAATLALANDFKGTSATANVVVVPAIVTRAMRDAEPDRPWGSFVPAEQIAESLVYLSSTGAAKMNGQRLRLYSGAPS